VSYDVLRSSAAADFMGATCVASGQSGLTASDPVLPPPPGQLHAYLVRVSNGCGDTLGADSTGAARSGADCP
jgi:hypothetical protein